jgi:hypothetical protein
VSPPASSPRGGPARLAACGRRRQAARAAETLRPCELRRERLVQPGWDAARDLGPGLGRGENLGRLTDGPRRGADATRAEICAGMACGRRVHARRPNARRELWPRGNGPGVERPDRQAAAPARSASPRPRARPRGHRHRRQPRRLPDRHRRRGRSVRIFDANTGKQLLALRHRHCVPYGLCVVNRAVFSPDGSKIATTAGTQPFASWTPAAAKSRSTAFLRSARNWMLGLELASRLDACSYARAISSLFAPSTRMRRQTAKKASAS